MGEGCDSRAGKSAWTGTRVAVVQGPTGNVGDLRVLGPGPVAVEVEEVQREDVYAFPDSAADSARFALPPSALTSFRLPKLSPPQIYASTLRFPTYLRPFLFALLPFWSVQRL